MKSNDGASLFIYTGSCTRNKKLHFKLRRDYQNNPVYYNFKHDTSYDAKFSMYLFLVNLKFNLVHHSLLQRHLRKLQKILVKLLKIALALTTAALRAFENDLIANLFYDQVQILSYQYYLKLELQTIKSACMHIHFVRHNYNTESKIALKVFVSLFLSQCPSLSTYVSAQTRLIFQSHSL